MRFLSPPFLKDSLQVSILFSITPRLQILSDAGYIVRSEVYGTRLFILYLLLKSASRPVETDLKLFVYSVPFRNGKRSLVNQ
jgi:hypothetical protein